MDTDRLVEAIRQRANDPERRVDERASEFFASARAMSLGQLFTTARGLLADLMRFGREDGDAMLYRRGTLAWSGRGAEYRVLTLAGGIPAAAWSAPPPDA